MRKKQIMEDFLATGNTFPNQNHLFVFHQLLVGRKSHFNCFKALTTGSTETKGALLHSRGWWESHPAHTAAKWAKIALVYKSRGGTLAEWVQEYKETPRPSI